MESFGEVQKLIALQNNTKNLKKQKYTKKHTKILQTNLFKQKKLDSCFSAAAEPRDAAAGAAAAKAAAAAAVTAAVALAAAAYIRLIWI